MTLSKKCLNLYQQNNDIMKITRHTIKKLAKQENLFLKVNSSFNGMIDGCETYNGGFEAVESTESNYNNTLGINGVWLVGSSRDYFERYEDDFCVGIYAYNCCGSFTLVQKK